VGFTDHHVHLLSTAACRLSVDVSAAPTVAEVCAALAPRGTGWLRGWGYDESFLEEGRHPTRDDLDRVNRRQPVVLHHRSGHAAVLNSAALAEVGEEGHPDGVLFDSHDVLGRVPRIPAAVLEAAAAEVSRDWARRGVACFTDATHTNGPEELGLLSSWRQRGAVVQEITAMVGQPPPGVAHGQRVGAVTVGHVKLMPGDGLAARVASAHAAGFPVAVHVVDVPDLDSALAAFELSPAPAGLRDRVEHNALCLPEQVARLAASGAAVVVNPSFLVHRAAKYRRQLSEVEHGWLVRIGSLVRAGIPVRAGSDSPVVPSRPAEMMASAVAHPFNPAESVDLAAAQSLLSPF
jgi:predicted amidohydrolase YtcJ